MPFPEMNFKKEQICRVCLREVQEFQEIDQVAREMFDILSLRLELDITREPIVCEECVEVAKKCLNFKLICFSTERIITLYSADRGNHKHNIEVIYKETKAVEMPVDLNICRICMTRERNNFVSLYTLMNATMLKTLLVCMPEMDIKLTDNSIICTICRGNLEGYIKFIMNCLDTEEKIKLYCMEVGTDSVGQVELGNLVQFLFKDSLKRFETRPGIYATKVESNIFEYTKCLYPEAYGGLVPFKEELHMKEEINLEEGSNKNLPQMSLDKYDDILSSSTEYTMCASETKQQHVLKTQMKIRTGKVDHKGKQNVNRQQMHKCSLCAYESKNKNNLKRHTMVHKDISEIKMHKCSLCVYQAKRKSHIRSHMLVHQNISEIKRYKCPLCAVEVKQSYFKRHIMSVHKDISEIKSIYKCSLCAYEAKYKSNLKTHRLVHKNLSEINTYKCSLCTYEGKRKGDLTRHVLVHKDISEIKTYKCSSCAYEAKQKSNLKTHMLTHADISEIEMYKCSFCKFEAKHKRTLKKHMLRHKDVSEIK